MCIRDSTRTARFPSPRTCVASRFRRVSETPRATLRRARASSARTASTPALHHHRTRVTTVSLPSPSFFRFDLDRSALVSKSHPRARRDRIRASPRVPFDASLSSPRTFTALGDDRRRQHHLHRDFARRSRRRQSARVFESMRSRLARRFATSRVVRGARSHHDGIFFFARARPRASRASRGALCGHQSARECASFSHWHRTRVCVPRRPRARPRTPRRARRDARTATARATRTRLCPSNRSRASARARERERQARKMPRVGTATSATTTTLRTATRGGRRDARGRGTDADGVTLRTRARRESWRARMGTRAPRAIAQRDDAEAAAEGGANADADADASDRNWEDAIELAHEESDASGGTSSAVSYTHLTLPTKA
mgnify:CR=1 FL=1